MENLGKEMWAASRVGKTQPPTCGYMIHPLWKKENFRYRSNMPPTGKIEVRRSARRRRTVSAYRDGDTTVVMVPARLSAAEERRWVATILKRLAEREARRRPGEDALLERARDLSYRYLDGLAQPESVRWVDNQRTRWGSCTPEDGTIRLSSRLRGMPAWVVDYLLIHELTHLIVPGHGPAFWEFVNRYPKAERARGFLEGVSAAPQLDIDRDVGSSGAETAGMASMNEVAAVTGSGEVDDLDDMDGVAQ